MDSLEGAIVIQIFFYNQEALAGVDFKIPFWVESHLQKFNLLNALEQVPLHLWDCLP